MALSPTRVKLTTDGPYPALLAQLVKLSIVPKHDRRGGRQGRLQPEAGRQRAVQVRGLAARRAGDADAQRRLLGHEGPVPGRGVPRGAGCARPGSPTSRPARAISASPSTPTRPRSSRPRPRPRRSPSSPNASPICGSTPAKPPFDNVKVRQAVAYAIDKEALVDGILGGYDKPVPEMLTPAHFGWVEGIAAPAYDLAKAQGAGGGGRRRRQGRDRARDRAGLRPAHRSGDPADAERCRPQREDRMSDMASYLKRAQGGPEATPSLSFGRWSCACQDADGVLFPLLHKSSSWSAYRNPEGRRAPRGGAADARRKVSGSPPIAGPRDRRAGCSARSALPERGDLWRNEGAAVAAHAE